MLAIGGLRTLSPQGSHPIIAPQAGTRSAPSPSENPTLDPACMARYRLSRLLTPRRAVLAVNPTIQNTPAHHAFWFLTSSNKLAATMAAPVCRFQAALRVTHRSAFTAPRALGSLAGTSIPKRQLGRWVRARGPVAGYGARRMFSGSSVSRLQTKEMDDDALKSLKVNRQRLMDDLHHTCQWGTGKRWGE